MIAKQQRRRNRWTLQPCLDVRISVLNKTLQRSIQRRYPAFQTPNDQPALNYSGYQIKKICSNKLCQVWRWANQPSSAAPAPPTARFSPSAPHQSCVSSSSSSAPFSKQSGQFPTYPTGPKHRVHFAEASRFTAKLRSCDASRIDGRSWDRSPFHLVFSRHKNFIISPGPNNFPHSSLWMTSQARHVLARLNQ
jgi:hypothetical protein